MDHFRMRHARLADATAIAALIDSSVRTLQANDYSPDQIEGALGTVFGVDTLLIADGTYFVVETVANILVGCGGWSKRKTLFGSDQGPAREAALLDPKRENARIRAFFVHPGWARKGIGSLILKTCEEAAIEAGFRGFELGATLTGERLYSARGYAAVERIDAPLPNGGSIPVIRMTKGSQRPPRTQ